VQLEASLPSTVGWQMTCHSCFRPGEVDRTVNETLAVFVFTVCLFYVLSHTPVELLDILVLEMADAVETCYNLYVCDNV